MLRNHESLMTMLRNHESPMTMLTKTIEYAIIRMLGNRMTGSEPECTDQRMSSSLSSTGKFLMATPYSQALPMEFVSPATRMLEKRRQMFEVQATLDARKEGFSRQEQTLHIREEGLRKKDLELQESLLKFNKFFQENESKRNRAVKRGNEEIKQRLTKEQEIEALKKTLASLMHDSGVLARQLKKHSKYSRYLEIVQEQNPEDFPEVGDLINRYRTLAEANRDLQRNQMQCEMQNEQKRAEYAAYQKERANEILNRNNRIASLQRALEGEGTTLVQLQQEADVSTRTTMQKTLALGQIFTATTNLVQRATSGMHGRLLKHAQSAATENSSTNELIGELSEADMMHHSVTAMVNLDIVACYVSDYASILQKRAETQRAMKKQNLFPSAQVISSAVGLVQTRIAGKNSYKPTIDIISFTMALQGKCALVVGVLNKYSIATSIAKSFLSEGAKVVAVSKTLLSKRAIDSLGLDDQTADNFQVVSCDVTKDADISALMEDCGAHFCGKLDILVHSVAYAPRKCFVPFKYGSELGSAAGEGGLLHTSKFDWNEANDTSAYSLIALTRAAFPLLCSTDQKADKSILALTFAGAEKVVPHYNMMGIAKASLEACARQLAVELGPLNIRVNTLSSGPVKTVSARGIPGISNLRQFVLENAPLRRNVSGEHIADTAVFLASEKAACIAGQTIHVDAGMSILSPYMQREEPGTS